jgi:hypothetical protein
MNRAKPIDRSFMAISNDGESREKTLQLLPCRRLQRPAITPAQAPNIPAKYLAGERKLTRLETAVNDKRH